MSKSSSINLTMIINGALKGDANSERKLYMDFHGLVYKTASRYMKTNEQTEEASNDVFVKVFSKLQQYDTNRSFSTWLIRITINHCIEILRVKKNRFLSEDLREDIEYDEADFTDLIDEVPMLPLIKDLPPMYRMVFNLYVIEEYSHAEVAKLLEISVGTSKSNLSRAKKLMLKRINDNPQYDQLKSKRI